MVPIHYEGYYDGGDSGAPRRLLMAETKRRGLESRVFALHTGERIVLASEPFVIRDTGAIERLAAQR